MSAFERCATNKQAAEDRLFCARATASAFREMARSIVRNLAARPRRDGFILAEEPCLYERFVSTNPLFQDGAFLSPQFESLCKLVRAAEDQELQLEADSPDACRLAQKIAKQVISPVAARVHQNVSQQLTSFQVWQQQASFQMMQQCMGFAMQVAQSGVTPTAVVDFMQNLCNQQEMM